MIDLLYICHDDRYRSKGLFDNTLTHAYDFKVKVTDLEILNANVFMPLHRMMPGAYSFPVFRTCVRGYVRTNVRPLVRMYVRTYDCT